MLKNKKFYKIYVIYFSIIIIIVNIFIENKNRSSMLEKNSRMISRSENRESNKNYTLYKTAPVRETKASRLRAASIISPNGKN